MQNDRSQEIIGRFFVALERLKEMHIIRGKATFCRIAGINRRNLWQLDKDRSRDIFQVGWLTYLVDLGVSPQWLLTGNGEIMKR